MQKRERDRGSLICMACIYILMVYFTSMTPWAADDFGYGQYELFSLKTIFLDEYHQYLTWTGRSIAHIIARILLSSPIYVHIIITPLIFCLLLLCGHIIVYGRNWREYISPYRILLLFSIVWFFTPSFGTVFFWRTGSANYCWTLFFAIAFLVPYRFLIDASDYSPSKPLQILLPLLGLLAGWSNENVGCIIILLAGCATLFTYSNNHIIKTWTIIGIICAAIGWLLLILAPGNYIRLQHPIFADYLSAPFFTKICTNILEIFIKQLFFIVNYAVCIYIIAKNIHKTPFKSYIVILFLLVALLSSLTFIFSPPPPNRAYTSTAFWLSLGLYTALSFKKHILKFFSSGFLILSIFSICINIYIFQINHKNTEERIQNFSSNEEILVTPYQYNNKYFFIGYEIEDFSTNEHSWTNESFYKKFHKKIRAIPSYPIIEKKEQSWIIYYQYWDFSFKEIFRCIFRFLYGDTGETIQDTKFLILLFKRASSHEMTIGLPGYIPQTPYYIGPAGGVLHKVNP